MIVDASGDTLSKSQDALPLDSAHPLPALRGAWRALGQHDPAMRTARQLGELLHAARIAFNRPNIPAGPKTIAATHNAADIGDD